jgi:hypothetical protein
MGVSRKESAMTAQIHETLILNGEETAMDFCPPLPANDPRIVEIDEEARDRESILFSTACWREYMGTWEIKDSTFYLVNLEGRLKLASESPIFADWFTGVLRIPQGDILHYVHMGFGTVYEKELHIKIEDGLVTESTTIDNRNKEINHGELGWNNLPGRENRFDGDEDL